MTVTKPIYELVELFKKSRRNEVSDSTYYNNSSHLKVFTQWCKENDVENSDDITGLTLLEYKIDREEVKSVTVGNELSTLRVFIRFCGKIEAVPNGLAENVPDVNLSKDELARDTDIDPFLL